MAAPLAGFAQARPFAAHRASARRPVCCSAKSDGAHRRHQLGPAASGLAALLAAPLAWAEGLELPADLPPVSLNVPELPSVPTDSAGLAQFVSDYPLLLPAAAGVLVVPSLISLINGSRSKVQGVSAAKALDVLSTEDAVAFVDIRSKESARQYGDPNLNSVKKSLVRVPYTKTLKGEYMVDDSFAAKFSKLRSLSEDTTVILLDSFGKEAPQAGQQIEATVGKVLYIQGGAEGPRGWKESELPWKEPGKFSLDFGALRGLGGNIDSFAEDFKSAPTAGKALVGVGVLLGGLILVFQEIDTALEVAGIFAAGQFALRRLLFAEDRQATQKQIKELVDDKIAVKDVPKDLKKLADKVLEAEKGVEKKATARIEKGAQEAKGQLKDAQKRVQGAAEDVKGEVKGVQKEVQRGAQDVKGELKDAQKEVQSGAQDVKKDLGEAADSAAREAGADVDAARDTVDLNGAGAPSGASSPQAEARRWIDNWKAKNA